MNPQDPHAQDQFAAAPILQPTSRPRRRAARHRIRSKQAFSLVELLVVLAVIATLASMLLPAVNEAFKSAENKRVLMEVKRIKAAIDAYYSVYGRLPHPVMPAYFYGVYDWTGWDDHGRNSLLTLSGADIYHNPRNITFLEISGTLGGWGWEEGEDRWGISDPWGNSYRILWDVSYDEKLTINPNGAPNKTYNERAIVYSHGPNGIWGGGDDIFSID